MKRIPIGHDNFQQIIEEDFYYVDKTKIIEDILKENFLVGLYIRPRRFGKSLVLSMLDNFFNIERKENNKELFKELYINNTDYKNEQNIYPIIRLDFKDLKERSYDNFYNSFQNLIKNIYNQKSYIKEKLSENERSYYDDILFARANEADFKEAIKNLSNYLYKYYSQKVIVLIDEYDVPIQTGYDKGYYNEVVDFMKCVFSSTLKGNESLKLGILTGVLRVSKESLFSDLNNLKVYDIMTEGYNEYFGFTEKETQELLSYYNLELTDDVKKYYNGYNMNNLSIYNPWSIINYASDKELKPYWINTASNSLIKELLSNISEDDKVKIEKLIQKEDITFDYNDKITYQILGNETNFNNILSLLLVCGYLTFSRVVTDKYGITLNYYKIPNEEVREDLSKIIESISLNDFYGVTKYYEFQRNTIDGNKEQMEKFINEMLLSTSYYDKYENFYHGYTLGLFSSFSRSNYIVKSNREAGLGRYDIMIKRENKSVGVIIEFKISDNENNMEEMAIVGLKQMKEKEYYKELKLDHISNIKEIVIVFYKNKCIVR